MTRNRAALRRSRPIQSQILAFYDVNRKQNYRAHQGRRPGLTVYRHFFHGSRRTGALPSSSFECVSHYGCSARTEELSLLTTALFILPSFIFKPLPICIRGESTQCIPSVSLRIDSLELAHVKVEPCGCLCASICLSLPTPAIRLLGGGENGILMSLFSRTSVGRRPHGGPERDGK